MDQLIKTTPLAPEVFPVRVMVDEVVVDGSGVTARVSVLDGGNEPWVGGAVVPEPLLEPLPLDPAPAVVPDCVAAYMVWTAAMSSGESSVDIL